ncbi:cysteine hydrolase [Leucobacter weissii]|uniref:Cysteine hydrolase n=1 Tax=Leucobacter weissii TaxID=1983706 RepID=A0A939MKR3_9MICO|nr:isochorismatase family cysteine hydrolase [Leucobacter weissii]MBO1901740.1 cysteine hydrolase [Leucobacter weissii]
MTIARQLDGFSDKMAQKAPPEIDRSAFALVVVDMVQAYLDPEGEMPVADPEPVIAAALRLIAAARAAGGRVIWVRPGHTEEADGLFRIRIPHAIGEDGGARIHPAFDPADDEKIVRKRRYSAFFGTDLDLYLREHGIRSVLVCGVALNICVRSTVHDAFFNGYDVFVVADACQATGPREHESSLYDIATHFGTVLPLDETVGRLERN